MDIIDKALKNITKDENGFENIEQFWSLTGRISLSKCKLTVQTENIFSNLRGDQVSVDETNRTVFEKERRKFCSVSNWCSSNLFTAHKWTQ